MCISKSALRVIGFVNLYERSVSSQSNEILKPEVVGRILNFCTFESSKVKTVSPLEAFVRTIFPSALKV